MPDYIDEKEVHNRLFHAARAGLSHEQASEVVQRMVADSTYVGTTPPDKVIAEGWDAAVGRAAIDRTRGYDPQPFDSED